MTSASNGLGAMAIDGGSINSQQDSAIVVSYHNWSSGGGIELGKQFKFQDDWFIKPQFQASYMRIAAVVIIPAG